MELSLGKVNILIGANGSGKSNFVDIFRFLSNIVFSGLESSISNQGGIEYIRNISFCDVPVFFEITYSYQQNGSSGAEPDFKIYENVYTLSIEPSKDNSGFRVTEDRALFKYRNKDDEINELVMSNANGKILLSDNQTEIDLKDFYRNAFEPLKNTTEFEFLVAPFQTFFEQFRIPDKSTLLENYKLFVNLKCYGDLTIYDLDPKLSKKAPSIFTKADLEEDGSNLVIVIKKILDDPEKKRMFLNLVTYLLPHIEDIEVDKFTETHFYLKIKETYSEKHYLPAPLISDGTINALGLIVALYFQESPLIIIEEPDRGFHPSLISRVVEMMKDAAEYGNKQIIVTTHNPEMVKYADPKDVLLVSRDEKGFSKIIRPSRKKDVKIFLDNGMRLSDLYVDELLEI